VRRGRSRRRARLIVASLLQAAAQPSPAHPASLWMCNSSSKRMPAKWPSRQAGRQASRQPAHRPVNRVGGREALWVEVHSDVGVPTDLPVLQRPLRHSCLGLQQAGRQAGRRAGRQAGRQASIEGRVAAAAAADGCYMLPCTLQQCSPARQCGHPTMLNHAASACPPKQRSHCCRPAAAPPAGFA
jgi:hypothetical protein